MRAFSCLRHLTSYVIFGVRLVDLAKDGDLAAIRIIMERLYPVQQETVTAMLDRIDEIEEQTTTFSCSEEYLMKSLAGVRRRVAELAKKLKTARLTESEPLIIWGEPGESSKDAMKRLGHYPALVEDDDVLVVFPKWMLTTEQRDTSTNR